MIIPEAYQIENLIRFLRLALREDTVCASELSSTADEVCTGALEIEPVTFGAQEPEINVAEVELPCICAREVSAVDEWAGPVRGQRASMRLWYVMRPPIGEPITKLVTEGEAAGDGTYHKVPNWAAADRWLRVVWWRINYWLDVHSFTFTVDTGPPLVQTTWDLLEDGQIWKIGNTRSVQYRHVAGLAMLEASFDISYVLPPYEASAAGDLAAIEFTLTEQNEAPTPDGPSVEGEITL